MWHVEVDELGNAMVCDDDLFDMIAAINDPDEYDRIESSVFSFDNRDDAVSFAAEGRVRDEDLEHMELYREEWML